MADRTFTEGEHYALVDDAIKRETAAAATRVSELETKVTELQNANDVLVTEKAAEMQRANQAAQALDQFKQQIETEKAQEAQRAERTAKVTEVAPALELTQERSDRIVAMSDEVFESYLADLREVAAKSAAKPADEAKKDEKKAEKAAEGSIPRESAAFAGSDTDNKVAGTVLGVIGASRALRSA